MTPRILASFALFLFTSSAFAYVDGSPSLGKIVNDATTIVVLKVDKVNAQKQIVVFAKVADLKGSSPAGPVTHLVSGGWHPREPKLILNWAEPGKTAVMFHNGNVGFVCIGPYWYQVHPRQLWWSLTAGRPELSYAYIGSTAKLAVAVSTMLAGKETVIPAVKHDGGRWATYSNVAFRTPLNGKEWPVWRIKARLDMPTIALQIAADPKWIVGDGAAGPEDVPALLAALKNADARIRADAVQDLGLIGPLAKTAVASLTVCLKDGDPLVRIHAAGSLARIDPANKSAVPALLEELKHRDAKVRRSTLESLGDLGGDAKGGVTAIADLLKDGDGTVRWTAAETLGQIGPEAAPAVSPLVASLKDTSVRSAAIDALGRIGPKAGPAVAMLTPFLSEDTADRWAAALALGRIGGPGARKAIPYIVPGLKSGDEKTRWDATIILWTIGKDARDAVPALIESINAGNNMAVDALAAVDLKASIPLLIQHRLKSADVGMRKYAADALGNAGADAVAAIPALTTALQDADAGVRDAAAAALKKIQKK